MRDSRHKKKTTFIGGMELVSLRCNRDFTSASSYGLGWYKCAIATQWYQFHTTDAWWFSLIITVYMIIDSDKLLLSQKHAPNYSIKGFGCPSRLWDCILLEIRLRRSSIYFKLGCQVIQRDQMVNLVFPYNGNRGIYNHMVKVFISTPELFNIWDLGMAK